MHGLWLPACATATVALPLSSALVTIVIALHHLTPHPQASTLLRDAHALLPPVAMISSGFTNAPVSQFLVFSTVIGALLATITDTRYYLHIQVIPHIWQYGQFWRFMTWQVGSPMIHASRDWIVTYVSCAGGFHK